MYSPVEPCGYRVVIRQDLIEEKSEAGIILGTKQQTARMQAGQTYGTIVAVGPVAFTGEDFGENERDSYQPGVKVMYRRYAGDVIESDEFTDEEGATALFHVCTDRDVQALVKDHQTKLVGNYSHL